MAGHSIVSARYSFKFYDKFGYFARDFINFGSQIVDYGPPFQPDYGVSTIDFVIAIGVCLFFSSKSYRTVQCEWDFPPRSHNMQILNIQIMVPFVSIVSHTSAT